MHSLREKLAGDQFLIGAELVSVRGPMTEQNAVNARAFASQLVECPLIDWISITDNAGGHPQLAPSGLGKPILYAGKEVVIHLTCKDLNRNGLESEAWLLHSEGFHNILAMTGDYPVSGNDGKAKPVFDIDSVGLISMLRKMNEGLDPQTAKNGRSVRRLDRTEFCIGAVTTNFKLRPGEVMPQYFKLRKKIECGAQFIINQIGFDARKASELLLYMRNFGMGGVPLIGNVYLLNPRVARLFAKGAIPGVVVTPALLEECSRHESAPDHGRAFFEDFAARQAAIYRGLGCRGIYLGGVHDLASIERILQLERSFAPNDWKQFAREIQFSRPGEFFYYGQNSETLLADASAPGPSPSPQPSSTALYQLSKWVHDRLFRLDEGLARWGADLCRAAEDPRQGPKLMRLLERSSKSILYQCQDCGDCSLPEIAFLCPESQCAKNQRNGPCGGTRDGRCEVDGFGDCIWLRAYERLRASGHESELLQHAPVVQNQGLRGTSAWANFWLGRDHTSKEKPPPASS